MEWVTIENLALILGIIAGLIIGFVCGVVYMIRQTEIRLKAREEIWDEMRGKSE